MSEADQRQILIQLLKPLNAVSVENMVGAGTPDMNYGGVVDLPSSLTGQRDCPWRPVHLEGWIECKWEKEWPARGGPLRVPHYTTQQKVWARSRRHRGGSVFLMLTVGRDWILLDGAVAATLPLGEKTREELMDAAVRCWDTPPDRDSLISALWKGA